MRKLVLEMEALEVESFEMVSPRAQERGTVRGQEDTVVYCSVLYPGDYSFDCSLANCSGDCGYPTQATCEGPGCYTHDAQENN